MRKSILICLMLVSSTAMGISTKLSDVLNQGAQAIPSGGAHKADSNLAHTISVAGTITSPDGSIAENFTVKAYAGKMAGSQLVGSTLSDGGGGYSIAFASNASVTVLVKVYCKTTLVATSAPVFNVTEGADIDVTVPNAKCAQGTPSKIRLGRPIPKTGN